MDLRVLDDRLSVCKLPSGSPWPVPEPGARFWSVTRTDSELSIVCPEDEAPTGEHVRVEPDWRALEVAGPLDFSMVGVMAGLTQPLADVDVSVFVVSTYDTDYVLVHAAALEKAVEALRGAGHQVHAG
ncbi:ACT domain-containing protein [Longivirga aurantiaca]|uniref:ACT domain-containing protein n=1 Tax=Longivirga aurantiaca TaxID=1837743 RepID=A0ABW1T3Q1_9ACTN